MPAADIRLRSVPADANPADIRLDTLETDAVVALSIYLCPVPSDANPADVRLHDPTQPCPAATTQTWATVAAAGVGLLVPTSALNPPSIAPPAAAPTTTWATVADGQAFALTPYVPAEIGGGHATTWASSAGVAALIAAALAGAPPTSLGGDVLASTPPGAAQLGAALLPLDVASIAAPTAETTTSQAPPDGLRAPAPGVEAAGLLAVAPDTAAPAGGEQGARQPILGPDAPLPVAGADVAVAALDGQPGVLSAPGVEPHDVHVLDGFAPTFDGAQLGAGLEGAPLGLALLSDNEVREPVAEVASPEPAMLEEAHPGLPPLRPIDWIITDIVWEGEPAGEDWEWIEEPLRPLSTWADSGAGPSWWAQRDSVPTASLWIPAPQPVPPPPPPSPPIPTGGAAIGGGGGDYCPPRRKRRKFPSFSLPPKKKRKFRAFDLPPLGSNPFEEQGKAPYEERPLESEEASQAEKEQEHAEAKPKARVALASVVVPPFVLQQTGKGQTLQAKALNWCPARVDLFVFRHRGLKLAVSPAAGPIQILTKKGPGALYRLELTTQESDDGPGSSFHAVKDWQASQAPRLATTYVWAPFATEEAKAAVKLLAKDGVEVLVIVGGVLVVRFE